MTLSYATDVVIVIMFPSLFRIRPPGYDFNGQGFCSSCCCCRLNGDGDGDDDSCNDWNDFHDDANDGDNGEDEKYEDDDTGVGGGDS